jgi:hypothetical protein
LVLYIRLPLEAAAIGIAPAGADADAAGLADAAVVADAAAVVDALPAAAAPAPPVAVELLAPAPLAELPGASA